MPRFEPRERRDRSEKFQTFSRPKVKITRISDSGTIYIDYKDTESLRKMVSGNGKISSRKRTGATAMEQRMLARAVKRAPLHGPAALRRRVGVRPCRGRIHCRTKTDARLPSGAGRLPFIEEIAQDRQVAQGPRNESIAILRALGVLHS